MDMDIRAAGAAGVGGGDDIDGGTALTGQAANAPIDVKAHLGAADAIVDVLPWDLGTTAKQRVAARGRVSALAHQVAALLAGGWTDTELRQILAAVPRVAAGPAAAAAAEKQWRLALKRAVTARREAARPPRQPAPTATN